MLDPPEVMVRPSQPEDLSVTLLSALGLPHADLPGRPLLVPRSS
jgi:hypothetical protein